MEKMNILPKNIETHWTAIGQLFSVHNEEEYDRASDLLNNLIDEIGTDEKHPLYGLLDTLGTVLHAYEEKYHEIPNCSGNEMLEFFMEEHALDPSDLPEIGTKETVLAILHGDRELTLKDIRALSKRFHVSPAVFV